MTANVKNKRRMSKRPSELELRFRKAYERLSWGQRQVAQSTFNTVHNISAGTFRNKMNGWSGLSETEVEWMEAYDPYAQHQSKAA